MADKTWLTFENKERLGEADIRAELGEFGTVVECDGAIGGMKIKWNVMEDITTFVLDEGWVMVAMESKAKAQKAVKKLKVFYCIIFIFNLCDNFFRPSL